MTTGNATSHAAPRGIRVLQWARRPGPVGGVTTAVTELTAELVRRGYDVRFVNTGAAVQALRAVPLLGRRRSLHLFHITRVWRAIVLAPIFAVLPGRSVLVLHSGSLGRQITRLRRAEASLLFTSLRAYDEIWAVNGTIRDALPSRLRRRTRVVVPCAHVAEGQPSVAREPHLLSVATNSGKTYYHANLALDAVELVRAEWPDARLLILAYDQERPEVAALRQRTGATTWSEVSMNLASSEITDVLSSCGVFLRPTEWDGDSVIVREALSLGARVVASDVCPRPAGVELAPLTALGFAEAILYGGRVSEGGGLGGEPMADAAVAAVQRLR